MLVVTDATLVSRSHEVVPGLVSPEANVVVLSTRQLQMTAFGDPDRPLESDAVRWNAATLLVHLLVHLLGHLLGHLLDLVHDVAPGTVVAPYRFDEHRRAVPPFRPESRRHAERAMDRVREAEIVASGRWQRLVAHLRIAACHPREAFAPALRGHAPLLALSLTRMAASAVVPVFVLLFTDEF